MSIQRFGHATVVSLLLEAGADWQHKDCAGRTALEWAKESDVNGAEDAAVVLGAWVASMELRDEMARHTAGGTATGMFGAAAPQSANSVSAG